MSFDAPLNKEHRVDWLKVRDWLSTATRAAFTSAYEYPTFEWHAQMTIPGGTSSVELQLWWRDFPDELTLTSVTPEGDAVVEQIAANLRTTPPNLGELRAMDRGAWCDWMVLLGSPDYR